MAAKYPPYAKSFFLHDRSLPLAWLYIGPFAWDRISKLLDKSQSVILPNMEAPENYKWNFLKGCIVICIPCGNTQKDYRKDIATELLYSGVIHVRFIFDSYKVHTLNYPYDLFELDQETKSRKEHMYLVDEYPLHEIYRLTQDGSEFNSILAAL